MINKINKYITENRYISEIRKYELKLEVEIQNICDISTKWKIFATDKDEVLDFCTQQELRVFEIKKSTISYKAGEKNIDLGFSTPLKPSLFCLVLLVHSLNLSNVSDRSDNKCMCRTRFQN